MPKMTHPNQDRPLSVQDAEVEAYTTQGWVLVGAPAKAEPKPAKKTAVKKAVTRKSVR